MMEAQRLVQFPTPPARQLTRQAHLPSIVIVDTERDEAIRLKSRLGDEFTDVQIALAQVEDEACDLPEGSHDVYVVHLSEGRSRELSLVVNSQGALRDASVVFWGCSAENAQVSAALALGITRIIPEARLVEWLRKALPALIDESRGRRLLRAAREAMPAIPAWTNDQSKCPARLIQAESTFRETYLRRLLAETGNCRRAAETAGVPYRTFYDMLKKLNLR